MSRDEKETARYILKYSKNTTEDLVEFVRAVTDKPDLDMIAVIDTIDYYEVLDNKGRQAIYALEQSMDHLRKYDKAPRRLIDCITNNPDREG
jgi:hypothetical protein